MKETDNIQDLFSKAFENHIAPVRPEVWQGIQAKMAATGVAGTAATKGLSSLTKWLIGAGVAGSVGVVSTILLMNSPELTSDKQPVQKEKSKNAVNSQTNEQVNSVLENTLNRSITDKVAKPVETEHSLETTNNFDKSGLFVVPNVVSPVENAKGKHADSPVLSDKTIIPTNSVSNNGTKSVLSSSVKSDDVVLQTSTGTVLNDTPITSAPIIKEAAVTRFPNVFTPNGDNENDYYAIESKNILEFHVFIMDGNNKIVFESDDSNFQWDGTNNGEPSNVGKYICVVTGKDAAGKWFKKLQQIDLIR